MKRTSLTWIIVCRRRAEEKGSGDSFTATSNNIFAAHAETKSMTATMVLVLLLKIMRLSSGCTIPLVIRNGERFTSSESG
jgi:hypothetical protein